MNFRFERKLPAHNGCVNCIAFSQDGSKIVSGSDDCHLQIYNTESGELLHRFATLHAKNIFSCKFLTDQSLISGSLDSTVQYHPSLEGKEGSHLFRCHVGMIGSVLRVSDQVFMSCSGDGTVNQYDLRIRDKCECTGCNLHTLIDVNAAPNGVCMGCDRPRLRRSKSAFGLQGDAHRFLFHGDDERIGVNDFDFDPLRPHLLALGCSDNFVRVFDTRKLRGPTWSMNFGNVVRPRSLEPAHGFESDDPDLESIVYPASMECYQALSYSFCPSHIREGNYEPYDNVTLDDLNFTRCGDEPELQYQSISERITELDEIPFEGNGVCSVKWFQDMLLVGYQDENLYLLQPSAILDKFTKWPKSHGTPFNLNYHRQWLNALDKKERKVQQNNALFGNFSYLGQKTSTNDWTASTLRLPMFLNQFAYQYDRDIQSIFHGNKNYDTMLKRADFVVQDGKPLFVTQGSDDGYVYLWKLNSGINRLTPQKPVSSVKGDRIIVNCTVPHPSAPYLAVSGLQSDVKILSPVYNDLPESQEPFSVPAKEVSIAFGNDNAKLQVERSKMMYMQVDENLQYALDVPDDYDPYGFDPFADEEASYHTDSEEYTDDSSSYSDEEVVSLPWFDNVSVEQYMRVLEMNPAMATHMRSMLPESFLIDLDNSPDGGIRQLAQAMFMMGQDIFGGRDPGTASGAQTSRSTRQSTQTSQPHRTTIPVHPIEEPLDIMNMFNEMDSDEIVDILTINPSLFSLLRDTMPTNNRQDFHGPNGIRNLANTLYQLGHTMYASQYNPTRTSDQRPVARPTAQARSRVSRSHQSEIQVPQPTQHVRQQAQRQQQDILTTLMQLNGRQPPPSSD